MRVGHALKPLHVHAQLDGRELNELGAIHPVLRIHVDEGDPLEVLGVRRSLANDRVEAAEVQTAAREIQFEQNAVAT